LNPQPMVLETTALPIEPLPCLPPLNYNGLTLFCQLGFSTFRSILLTYLCYAAVPNDNFSVFQSEPYSAIEVYSFVELVETPP
jgi:hypothetical protein